MAGCTKLRETLLDHVTLKHLLSSEPKAFVNGLSEKEVQAAVRELGLVCEDLSTLEKLLSKLQEMQEVVQR